MCAYLSDLYVAPLDRLSMRGMVSTGYEGDHELVVGGYTQVVQALMDNRSTSKDKKNPLRDIRLKTRVTEVKLPALGNALLHLLVQDAFHPKLSASVHQSVARH